MLQLMREGCYPYTYSPLSIVQLSELEQFRVKQHAQGFNTAAQDSNPGSRSRESTPEPLRPTTTVCVDCQKKCRF